MRLLMRNYFSTYQLWSAELAAAQAAAFERDFTGKVPVFSIEQRSYVMNAVFMSVAFLESAINEILQDIVDEHDSYTGPVDPVIRRCITVWWGQSEGQGRAAGSILDKYQSLLAFYGLPALDKGRNPYQDVDLLVRLRNELMHYKPEMVGGEEQHRWDKKLSKKFAPNPLLAGSGNSYFPDHCLGSGCAAWAVQSVKAFADAYFTTLGISSNYARPHNWPKPEDIVGHPNQGDGLCHNREMNQMTLAAVFKLYPRLHELENRLTDFGGDPYIALSGDRLGGCLTVPDLERQITEGRLVDLTPTFREGKENECHENCIALFEQDETLVVMSGFALADDRKWYHHSWCIEDRGGDKSIVETVRGKFFKYYGIEYAGRDGVQKLRDWLAKEMPKAPEIKQGSATDAIANILNQH